MIALAVLLPGAPWTLRFDKRERHRRLRELSSSGPETRAFHRGLGALRCSASRVDRLVALRDTRDVLSGDFTVDLTRAFHREARFSPGDDVRPSNSNAKSYWRAAVAISPSSVAPGNAPTKNMQFLIAAGYAKGFLSGKTAPPAAPVSASRPASAARAARSAAPSNPAAPRARRGRRRVAGPPRAPLRAVRRRGP